ncbi:EscU/YscU/HrcU family type III secretion system export apparatus switch protein, partial [Treponema pallidum]
MKRKRACSVALSYATGDKAPIIVASGTGAIAEKIVEIAKKFDIALVQDELLARVL